ncbi:MAG TPA: Crp/Fnr family transcriptional regulator [Gemmatimonadaceae bacterium]|jgi:CRP-like cAMP-binding protein
MISDSAARTHITSRDGVSPVAPARNGILAGLPESELAAFLERAEEVEFPSRSELFQPGEPIQSVYFPLSGMISMVIVLKDGTMIEAITVGKEGFTGAPVVNDVHTSRYRGVCQVAGRFLSIEASGLIEVLESAPILERKLRHYVQYASDVTGQSAACNSIHTIEQRSARWLLVTADAVGTTEFSLTQEFLSQMLAVRRPGVNVAMRALSRRALISHRYGKVSILDLVGLRQASCECYATISEKAAELLE